MTPGNPFLGTVAAIPFPSGVKCHSIIAAEGDGPLGEANDGVVEYESAHLEGAASEFVVRCGHSCQAHPLTILEVRRILMAHLGESRAPGEAKR
jgi:hypothetical protein